MLFFSILLIEILVITPAIHCLLNNSVQIHCTGEFRFLANSGSVGDIQAAVDGAETAGGGTVYVPAGHWIFEATSTNYVGIPGGVNVFGVGINATILDMPDDVTDTHTTMFVVDGSNGKKTRISGMTFKGRKGTDTGDLGIRLTSCIDFRIDHCSFHDMGSVGVYVKDDPKGDISKISQGVIDHCSFIDIYKAPAYSAGNGYGYGVSVSCKGGYEDYPWDPDIWNILGKYNHNTFIEDCYFSGCRHNAQAGICGGVYVFRHNTVENVPYYRLGWMTGHPPRMYDIPVYGMRCWEIYNNIFDAKTESCNFLLCEGGGGVIFNNTIIGGYRDTDIFVDVASAETSDERVAQEGSPHDLWIWDNFLTGVETAISARSQAGNPVPQEWDGSGTEPWSWYTTQEPWGGNYTPYPYPHPLTVGE